MRLFRIEDERRNLEIRSRSCLPAAVKTQMNDDNAF